MATPPVLILGFNRPHLTANLLASLANSRPESVIFSVDGPREDHPDDLHLVSRTQELVNNINWPCTIETRFREKNLGLRGAVVDAVSHATSKFGKVIVVEDDVVVGPNFLPYMVQALDKYDSDMTVGHINGYNVVPNMRLARRNGERRTRYIESFAWATWERSWRRYDDSLEWALKAPLSELLAITGTRLGAIRWRRVFKDAQRELIDTWAYRWLATLWSHNWMTVSPSENLVLYKGWSEGTHTRRKPKWKEQPVKEDLLDFRDSFWSPLALEDRDADKWLGATVFGESVFGVVEGLMVSLALSGMAAGRGTER